MKRDYFEGADVAVTICGKDGTILDMNGKSRRTFLKPGREELIGHNVLDCHPEPVRSLLADMLESPRTNVYTVEKEGVKKLIFQCPWYDGDEYAGFYGTVDGSSGRGSQQSPETETINIFLYKYINI